MAKMVFTNAQVKINNVDLSSWVADVTLDVAIAPVKVTAMGSTFESNLAGLGSGKVDVTFFQDFAAAAVDATLWPIVTGGSAVAFSIIGNGTVTSATNPRYSGSVILTDYPPFTGAVGAALQAKASFVTTGPVTSGTV